MSSTEIFGFGSDGKVKSSCDIRNAWRGAHSVWTILEKKYLPSLPKPEWASITEKESEYWSRTGTPCFDNKKPHPMKPIWDLAYDGRLSRNELICLCSTFDNVLVKAENLSELIEAFVSFEGETSLKEQAEGIELLLKDDPNIQAIGFNQTSVNADNWWDSNYNEETEESESYNFLTEKTHWWLFDSIKKEGE